MRFMIASYQGLTNAPDGSPLSNMQVLDMIEAPTAEDAIQLFKEDNGWMSEAGFSELFCIELSSKPFRDFSFTED